MPTCFKILLQFTLVHATWLYSDPFRIILRIHKKISTVIFGTVVFLLQYFNQVSVNEIWTLYVVFFFVYFDTFNDVSIAKLNNEFERKWMETAVALFGSLSQYLSGEKHW
jgi:hypothetical protein